jgi:soluble lytic murein transglycosylase-like protein
VVSVGWRTFALSALLLLPAWAALHGTHRTAQLPQLAAGVGEPFMEAPLAAVVSDALEAAVPLHIEIIQPQTTPFPPRVARWRPLVEAELTTIRATRGLNEAITPDLVLAVIAAESGGDPDARSHAHAAGLMQVLPTTLASLLTDTPSPNVFDPTANVRAGILYLDEAIRHHRGSLEWALAAYNAGMANVEKYGDVPPFKETRNYVKKITGAAPPVPVNVIYKWMELVNGKPVVKLSNKPPATGSYQIVGQ